MKKNLYMDVINIIKVKLFKITKNEKKTIKYSCYYNESCVNYC